MIEEDVLRSKCFPDVFSTTSEPIVPYVLVSVDVASNVYSSCDFATYYPLSPATSASVSSYTLDVMFDRDSAELSSSVVAVFVSYSFLLRRHRGCRRAVIYLCPRNSSCHYGALVCVFCTCSVSYFSQGSSFIDHYTIIRCLGLMGNKVLSSCCPSFVTIAILGYVICHFLYGYGGDVLSVSKRVVLAIMFR